jgi:hypothetical protein
MDRVVLEYFVQVMPVPSRMVRQCSNSTRKERHLHGFQVRCCLRGAMRRDLVLPEQITARALHPLREGIHTSRSCAVRVMCVTVGRWNQGDEC